MGIGAGSPLNARSTLSRSGAANEARTKQDPAGSLKHFAAAIAAAPDYFEAYYHLGVAEAQLNRNEEAMGSFQTAIDLSDGRYPRAEFGYALMLTRIGSAAEAESIVRHGLETDANIPDGHVVLGLILLKLHRVDEAERSAQRALLLEQPSSAKGHLILADVEGARGEFARQADELEAYMKSCPHDRNQKYLEAACGQKVGGPEIARPLRLLRFRPPQPRMFL